VKITNAELPKQFQEFESIRQIEHKPKLHKEYISQINSIFQIIIKIQGKSEGKAQACVKFV
jgi:hypothetical protein